MKKQFSMKVFEELKRVAMKSDKKRARLCLHSSHDSLLQEMLIVLHKSSAILPHRQKKEKSYLLLQGALQVLFLKPNGQPKHSIEMKAKDSKKPFLIRFNADQWHTVKAKTQWVVYLETTTGPYRATDTRWLA